ncbi:hypothetical protein [Fischerella thermalis]|nr:hypothetical protein [Fischerella thermalis]
MTFWKQKPAIGWLIAAVLEGEKGMDRGLQASFITRLANKTCLL